VAVTLSVTLSSRDLAALHHGVIAQAIVGAGRADVPVSATLAHGLECGKKVVVDHGRERVLTHQHPVSSNIRPNGWGADRVLPDAALSLS